ETISDTGIILVDAYEDYAKESSENLSSQHKSDNLAYVIYTSGTTGKPKGVMVEHSACLKTIYSRLSGVYRTTSFWTSYAFDVSVFEIFSGILSGAALYIVPNSARLDAALFSDFLLKNNIEYAYIPPYFLGSLMINEHSSLKAILTGVDSINFSHIKHLVKHGIKVFNAYGPTEASICCTSYIVENIEENIFTNQQIPIGSALENDKLYVLDDYYKPVPIGVIGELYIGGSGLARGYLNQEKLSQEVFINSLELLGCKRAYKSGDLVKWLPDGNLQYMGRSDQQVKIRGHRIEISEIRNILSSYPKVEQVHIQIKQSYASKHIIAYYVSRVQLNLEDLLNYLSRYLPDYMIPSDCVRMSSFPLTINGKLDEAALPLPNLRDQTVKLIAPRNSLENDLFTHWQQVLGIHDFGVTHDFFNMGGDSILSIQLTAKLRANGIYCTVKDIFDYRTIEQLAKYLEHANENIFIHGEQGVLQGSFNLLPIQKWFFEQVKERKFLVPEHWNQSFLIKVPLLDVDKLKKSIYKLMLHHDMLRVCYAVNDKSQLQTYTTDIASCDLYQINISQLTQEQINKQLTLWQSHFDLENGPLCCFAYLHGYADNTARIFFSAHHLIIDTVSWRILIEDLATLYREDNLMPKSTSYREWVDILEVYPAKYPKELDFWKNQCDYIPDYWNTFEIQSVVYRQHFSLSKTETYQLLRETGAAYHTEINDLLLTAIGLALQAWQGGDVQVVTLESHGREHIEPAVDLSRTIGWFTTFYPVKLKLEDEIGSVIKQVKESLRAIPNKGLGFTAFNLTMPVAPITFNYLGQFDNYDVLWRIVSEDSGRSINDSNQDHNLITINSLVIDSTLQFSIISKIDKQETDDFIKQIKTFLDKVTQHCIDRLKNNAEEWTPSDFKTVSISSTLLNKLQRQAQSEKNQIVSIFPATSLQQGFIYYSLSHPDDDAYRIQTLFDYHQALDIELYQKAWQLVIKTFPALRTGFNWEEELTQIIYQEGEFNCEFHDLSHCRSSSDKESAIESIQEKDRHQTFDLTKPSLLRLHIIKLSSESYTIIKTQNHSITDGWSGPALLQKVHEYYYQLQKNYPIEIKIDDAYFDAQNYYFKNQGAVNNYWHDLVATIKHTNDLQCLFEKTIDLEKFNYVSHPCETDLKTDAKKYLEIQRLAKEEGLTLNVLVQYAWHKLLRVYTQDEQTIVGTTISGRSIPVTGIEHSVGLYINTLPLVLDWNTGRTVRAQLNEIHARITEMNNHCYVNLSKLQTGGRRLFHSLFVFENYPLPENQGGSDKLVALMRESIEKVDYALALVVVERQGMLELRLKYDGELLSAGRAQSYLETISEILNGLSEGIEKQDEEFSLLTKEKSQELIYGWNEASYTNDRKDLVGLFELQAKLRGEESALWCRGESLSYEALNKRSNQVARYLRRIGVGFGREELVLLCVERGIDLVVGVLGILKAGGAYVPVLPEYPVDRMDYILKDTKSKYVLTEKLHADKFKDAAGERAILCIDEAKYQRESEENLGIEIQSSDLAYVIYTSGTTGRPKGV
ncbi:MAG: AMP-binding protein, partial [Proteobacteria bacterium]|nr:AMP-binding protein [Pseudomonadota bacterium]